MAFNIDKTLRAFVGAKNAKDEYEKAIEAGDSEAAIKARNKGIDAANLAQNPQKLFNRTVGAVDKLYKNTFGVDAGTIKYNSQKGEADIEKGGAPASSESQGGGTFLTAGAVMDGNTMLTRGAAKKKTLLGGD